MIEIQSLTKQYANTSAPAVKGISLHIREREIFGLLGPNGAGKTTTISMLCGLVKPSGGSVSVKGKRLSDHFHELRSEIGIVPQDIALYPSLSARENLEFYGAMYGVEKSVLKARIARWLDKMELSDVADRRVENYSGGMKRRVNLIAGILHEPTVLFLDEPTVGVDVQSRSAIIEHLRELNANGMTVLYTSHHMDEAEKFCTEVAIMDHGQVLIQGSPEKLIEAHAAKDLEEVFLKLTDKALRN
jgi:ABC-2 type transport system ATP-binding protein